MYRLLRYSLAVMVMGLIFFSCEKETSQENTIDNQQNTPGQGTTSGTALFVATGTPGPCTTPDVNGIYRAGTALDGTNTAVILVNVTAAGSYNISTAITNGIYFAGSGNFTSTGLQSVTLQGQGIPISTGTYNYMAGANSCSFPVVVQSAGSTNTNCKSCSYFPMCDNSSYTYKDTTDTGISTRTEVYSFLRDTLIDGLVFQKFNITGYAVPQFSNCTAGVTTQISFNEDFGGIVVPRIDRTLLKANSPVGTTWQNSINLGSGITATLDWSLVEKGIARTVLGNAFPDVIHVHLSVSTVVPGLGTIPVTEGEYYYAKNVGLVESQETDISTGVPVAVLHRVIQAYSIP